MAFIGPQDRILESTTTSGTGAIALTGAVLGFRPFSAVCAVGDTLHYFIEALDATGQPSGDYEYGIGTYSATNTLTRTTVLGSSNAGATVSFGAGSKNVGLSLVSAGYARSLAANGYQRLPSGLLMQWGSVAFTARDQIVTFNFPTAFATLFQVLVTSVNAEAEIIPIITAQNTTSVSIESRGVTGSAPDAGSFAVWAVGL